jgi:CrcB protein
MNSLFLVMAGGAVGAGARYLTGRAMTQALGSGWPWGTLTVNLVGGLLMGLLVGALARNATASGETWRLLLGVGVLGGYTTFSSFALDVVGMIERGALAAAFAYTLLSVIGAVAALFAGLALVRVPA